MDALTIIIMLILFIIAMIFVFSTALLTPYIGKKNLVSILLLGLIVGGVGGAFLLSPIVGDIPDFSRTIIEENIEGTDEISMGLSTNRNVTQLIENISSISGVQKVTYQGIEIRTDEPFESPAMKETFFSRIRASSSSIEDVEDMGNNSYFIKIKENGDPQQVLSAIYDVFGAETYVHLRYTSMDANATVSANNVTKIMNAIADSGAIIHNVSGPTEDQVAIVNKYTPNSTDIVIISAIVGVIVALVGFFIDSIFSFRKRRKKAKKESTRDQIKRKTVPKSQRTMPKSRKHKKNIPQSNSIDIFNDESFENSSKQTIGSNRDFKQLTKDDFKEESQKQEDNSKSKSKKGIFGRFKKSKDKKDKKEDKQSGSQRQVPKIKPRRRD